MARKASCVESGDLARVLQGPHGNEIRILEAGKKLGLK
jgi:hypothetical protein